MSAVGNGAAVVFGTASEHVTRDVPVAGPADTVGAVRAGLEGRRFESAVDVAVVQDGRLLGLVTIEDLLGAPADTPVREVMDTGPPVVTSSTDQEHAAWAAVAHGESSLAVVDDAGRFVGLIPPIRMLAVLLAEHDEDMARLGGFLSRATAAERASQEPLRRRLWHRIPWLLVGLGGAMLTTALMGAFEAELQREVTLAFFVPAVVYMADAVGTQTETLVVRDLSFGVPIGRVAPHEALTGVWIGLAVAAVFFAYAALVWGSTSVAIVVAVSLAAACSVAGVVALVLPWALSRRGIDPAFGSGPLATVVQDVISVAIYLVVAGAVL